MVIRTIGLVLIMAVACTISINIAAPASAAPSKGQPHKASKTGSISESRALEIVSSRPEVKAWKKQVTSADAKKRGVTAHIALDRVENGEYIIQVFEEVPDGADSGHTATFNWYHVNKKSGAVTTEF